MAPRTRTAIAQGCYLDATGVTVIARLGSGTNLRTSKPVRFGLVDADGIPYSRKNNAELIKCYLQLVAGLRDERAQADDAAGTLGAEIDRWRLAFPLHVDAATGKEIKNDTHANDHIILRLHWQRAAIAARPIADVKRSQVRAQLQAWFDAGSAASTVNHRKRALATVLRWSLGADDDEDIPIATDGIAKFGEPEAEPRGIPMPILTRILATMPDRGRSTGGGKGTRPTYSETKIRLRVMAWTGLAHKSLERLERRKVNFREEKMFYPPRKKGKNAKQPKVGMWADALPEAMSALRDFDQAHLWGKSFSRSSMWKSWRRALKNCRAALVIEAEQSGDATMLEQFDICVPPNCKPYDTRHSFLTDFYEQSGDHKATKEIGQHASEKTTDRYTKRAVPTRIAAGVEKMRAKWFPNAAKPATVRNFEVVK